MRDSNGLNRRVVNLFHNLETAGPFQKSLLVSFIPLEQTRPLRYQCSTVESIKRTGSCLLLWLLEFEIYPLRLMSCLQLLCSQILHGWMLQVEPVIRYQLLYQIYLTIYFVLACCILNFHASIVLKEEMNMMCIENGCCKTWCTYDIHPRGKFHFSYGLAWRIRHQIPMMVARFSKWRSPRDVPQTDGICTKNLAHSALIYNYHPFNVDNFKCVL